MPFPLELLEELELLTELEELELITLEDELLTTLEEELLTTLEEELLATEEELEVLPSTTPYGAGCELQVLRAIQLRFCSHPQPLAVVVHKE